MVWASAVCLLGSCLLHGQATDAVALANQQKAHAVLAATIQALGGQAWLDLRTSRCRVRMAAFFQGNPTGEVADATISSDLLGKERIELDKGRVVQIFSGTSGWEITYKGRRSAGRKAGTNICVGRIIRCGRCSASGTAVRRQF